MKKGIKNIKASIRARLKNISEETNRPFQEILQYYGMERFLYRLSKSEYKDRFILKGALMLSVWDVSERRSTVDIDFEAQYDNKIKSIKKVIENVCRISIAEDGLEFDEDTVRGEIIKEEADYEGVRIKLTGFLERAKIPIKIDVAFGDKIYPSPKSVKYPVILDMPEPVVKGYPVESLVSEKFEAMVKLGALNSRMKDFYDIWVLMRSINFNGIKLARALKNTFENRDTILPGAPPLFDEEIYDKKSDRQTLWKAFLKKNSIKNKPEYLEEIARQLEDFLIEPIKAAVKAKDFKKEWIVSGPWK